MGSFSVDKKFSDSDVSLMLDDILCKEEYPNSDRIDLVDLKEYDKTTRQVFLWVSNLFTNEEWEYIESKFRESLHRRTRVGICRSNFYFGMDEESNFEYSD